MIGPKTDASRRRTLGRRSRTQVEKVRDLVYLRDDYRCLAAGSFWDRGDYQCAGTITIQHAIGRGMGGSAIFDGPELLRTFCIGHNVLETSDAGFHAFCFQMGWSLRRNAVGVDATRVPVRYPDGHDYLLGAHLERVLLRQDEAAELRALYGMSNPEAEA